MKYLIKARLEVDGRVERHDVIGAIFGQTEGLLGSGFNLEELQDKDKIGRVHVELKYHGTKTSGIVQVPSNLDRVETAILAAMLETVDKIGPYKARIMVEEIKDLRVERIKKIIERSRELLRNLKEKEPDIKEIVREVLQEVDAKQKVVSYGPDKLPAGPDVDKSDSVIIVEGRADVINLLRYGYTNVIAIEGAREKIPATVIELSKKKKAIAFVDGDRGGELVLRTLLEQANIDYVARAPPNQEVENLTGKEIAQALSEMIPANEVKKELGLVEEKKEKEKEEKKVEEEKEEKQPEEKPAPTVTTVAVPKKIIDTIKDLKGTLEAILFDKEWNELERVKVKDLYERLQNVEEGKVHAIVFDGIITQRILDIAGKKNINILIGARLGSKLKTRPENVHFMTFNDLT
ncbi:MAG: DNA primase [Desulfurococcales archaeon]|nr:DNA primase [Desulfurococcales archaeon]